jgi:hypothetical protein
LSDLTDDDCYDFHRERELVHRTHLYYLDYSYEVGLLLQACFVVVCLLFLCLTHLKEIFE